MPMIKLRRKSGSRPVFVTRRVANALIKYGTFEIAGSLPSAKPEIAKAHAAGGPRTAPVKEAAEAKEAKASLEAMTKAEIADLLRSGGEKVDMRDTKDRLVAQAMRYRRRDMRAEP